MLYTLSVLVSRLRRAGLTLCEDDISTSPPGIIQAPGLSSDPGPDPSETRERSHYHFILAIVKDKECEKNI